MINLLKKNSIFLLLVFFIVLIFYFFYFSNIKSNSLEHDNLILNEKYKFEELSAVQGLDSYVDNDKHFILVANGYQNSIAILENTEIKKALIIENNTGENDPELIADAHYFNGSIYWSSWRNGYIYCLLYISFA